MLGSRCSRSRLPRPLQPAQTLYFLSADTKHDLVIASRAADENFNPVAILQHTPLRLERMERFTARALCRRGAHRAGIIADTETARLIQPSRFRR